jgi:heat shock protein HtpX
MKFAQMAKRIFLFALVNILVVTTLTAVLGLLGVGRYIPQGGLGGLAVFCLVWGFGGAFISLLISRLMAKWMMGVKVIPADTTDQRLRELVGTVHGLAHQAGLPEPEVGIYDSPDVNAFATGPSRSRALVAVSTGLLQNLNTRQATAVLGHEITHIANGDMVTMALIQGVLNALVLFVARIVAMIVSQALRGRDERGGYWFEFMLYQLFQYVFSLFGFMVVCWFSRQREYRADAGGARLAGRQNMIDALRALESLHDPRAAAAQSQGGQAFQVLKISGSRRGSVFATHPPLEERIARLEAAQI